jgi:hypothetical protein
MALFGAARDISLLRTVNRELMGNIVSQQAAFYKFKLEETTTNIYGEAAGTKYYMGPVLLNCLIERADQTNPDTDYGVDIEWPIEFRFLRDDLLGKAKDFNIDTALYGADLVPQPGDIILYNGAYFEVNDTNANKYFVGKNPDYPNNPNPFENDLSNFGWNQQIICKTHYIPSDKVGITLERL